MGRKIFVLIISLFLLISCNTRAKKEAMQSYEKGKELGMQGKFEEALQMFNHAIKIYPDLPEAHNGAGFAYFNMKKYKEAEEEFLKAIKLKNDYIKPYNSLGDMYFAKGELAKAIEVWEKYLNIDPNVAELHAKVGQAKMSEASGLYYNMNAALEHLQKAVNIDRTIPSFRLLLADCYQQFKEFLPNSITEYNTILNMMNIPGEITRRAYSGLANSYLALEKDEEAYLTINSGLKLYPDDLLMNLYAGQIFSKSGKKEKAEASFKKAIQLDPSDIRTYIQLPNLYINDGEFEKAIGIYEMGIAKLPNFPILHLNLGLLYAQRLDNCEKAIEFFKKALALKIIITFVPYGEIGKCLQKQGKQDEALEMLQKALKEALDMDSKYASECRYHIAEIYKSKKDYLKMKEEINKIIETDPDSLWAENGKKILKETGV